MYQFDNLISQIIYTVDSFIFMGTSSFGLMKNYIVEIFDGCVKIGIQAYR